MNLYCSYRNKRKCSLITNREAGPLTKKKIRKLEFRSFKGQFEIKGQFSGVIYRDEQVLQFRSHITSRDEAPLKERVRLLDKVSEQSL